MILSIFIVLYDFFSAVNLFNYHLFRPPKAFWLIFQRCNPALPNLQHFVSHRKYYWNRVNQGRLKIWTEHSTLILLISIPFEVVQQKFQHFYNLARNEFSLNLKGVAQKMCPPRPFSFWTSQGHGSLFKWVMPFKFGGKLKTHEYYNWWKFGVNISNHFWVIQN